MRFLSVQLKWTLCSDANRKGLVSLTLKSHAQTCFDHLVTTQNNTHAQKATMQHYVSQKQNKAESFTLDASG